MQKSKVFFADFRCSDEENLTAKFTRLLRTAGLGNAAPIMPGCALDGKETHGDLFTAMHPSTRWRDAVAEGERIGLGSRDYKLVRI